MPPFTISRDNQLLIINPNLQKFLEAIKTRTGQVPSTFLAQYLDSPASRRGLVTELELDALKDVRKHLFEMLELAERRSNLVLGDEIEQLQTRVGDMVSTWNSVLDAADLQEKNRSFIEVKKNISAVASSILQIPLKLFNLPIERPRDTFSRFLLNMGVVGDYFNWYFYESLDPTDPSGTKDAIIEFKKMVEKIERLVNDFERQSPSERIRIVNNVKAGSSLKVLWAVDVPNCHFLDLKQAFDVLDELYPNNTSRDLWAFIPEQYLQTNDKYNDIYRKFAESNFEIKHQAKKNKKEDIDALFTGALQSDAVRKANYSAIILSMADAQVINIIKEIQQTCPGITIYLFISDVLEVSLSKVSASLGNDFKTNNLRFFNIWHMELENTHYLGTIKLKPSYFNDPKRAITVCYAEKGHLKDFKIKRKSFNHWPILQKEQEYQIEFFPRPQSDIVDVFDLIPINR